MRRGAFPVVFGVLGYAALGFPVLPANAQVVWPDPPGMQRPAPPPAAAPRAQEPQRFTPPPPPPPPELEQAPAAAAPARPRRAAPAASAASLNNIRCDGPFAKDSSQAKLAQVFGAKNVVTQPVDVGGSTAEATVLFPNDPKRRLEVMWHDAAAKRRPSAIVITGDSTWRARGFRIGETLAAVEKTNGKPFRLSGFEGDYSGAARDWQGGSLDKLSGGCRLGMRFAPAPSAARGKAATAAEFQSNAEEITAASPTIVELIVGYAP